MIIAESRFSCWASVVNRIDKTPFFTEAYLGRWLDSDNRISKQDNCRQDIVFKKKTHSNGKENNMEFAGYEGGYFRWVDAMILVYGSAIWVESRMVQRTQPWKDRRAFKADEWQVPGSWAAGAWRAWGHCARAVWKVEGMKGEVQNMDLNSSNTQSCSNAPQCQPGGLGTPNANRRPVDSL